MYQPISMVCILKVAYLPVVPVDPVAEALVLSTQVETVQVGVVAGAVPPRALKPAPRDGIHERR
jgi:hypothetical protein